MTTSDVGGSGVPQFLTKLWLLVEDSSTDHLIKWGQEGTSFIVLDQTRFAKEVLPQFFKHSNMASFIRQLNMYGFRKKTSIDQGALRSVREDVEFMHPHFKRGEPTQLELIKRKVTNNDPKVKTEEVNKILSDVKGMKVKQDDISGTLESMKRENQALWSEVMILRQRHDKQQKIVNRLIQFLLTLVNPVGVKRKQHLAIEAIGGGSSGPSRQAKYGRQVSLHASNLEDLINLQTASNLEATASLPSATLSDITGNHTSSGGATVSEVTSPLDPTAKTVPNPNQPNQQTVTQQQQTQPTIVRVNTLPNQTKQQIVTQQPQTQPTFVLNTLPNQPKQQIVTQQTQPTFVLSPLPNQPKQQIVTQQQQQPTIVRVGTQAAPTSVSSIASVTVPNTSGVGNVTFVHAPSTSGVGNVTFLPAANTSGVRNVTLVPAPNTSGVGNVTLVPTTNTSGVGNVTVLPAQNTSGVGNVTVLPAAPLMTPVTLVPGLGDIATMPMSEILAPSPTSAATMPVSSSPIITSPPPSVESSLNTPEVNLDTPEMSMELIPKESGDTLQSPYPGMLKRALSTEEIEQKEQLGTDLNALQANLDTIQNFLSGNSSLSVDPDVLLGVFNHGGGLGVDDANLFDLTSEPSYDFNPANFTGTTGTEMIEYNPDSSMLAAAGISGVDVSDEDSLLESLNEDSRALAKNRIVQEEID